MVNEKESNIITKTMNKNKNLFNLRYRQQIEFEVILSKIYTNKSINKNY